MMETGARTYGKCQVASAGHQHELRCRASEECTVSFAWIVYMAQDGAWKTSGDKKNGGENLRGAPM